jgi:hypothetical protein
LYAFLERFKELTEGSEYYENYPHIWWPSTIQSLEGKVKAIPLQAWTDPEGSRRLRLPDFKTIGT